jgi:DNA-binding MurR/RpiR family transcriptional regulator
VRRLADSPVGSRRSIAQLLLSEGSGITSLSMGEVARLSYTSKPSLVRFAQTLGFAG